MFFTSRKTVLKSWLDTSSIPCYLSSFLSFFLSAISTPPWYLVDRSRKLPACSIAPRHLVDRSSFWSWIWFFVARYLSIPQLSMTRSSTASSIPLDTSAVEHYWRVYIYFHRDPSLISSISLDLSVPVHLPNTLFFTLNFFLKVSSSFFKFFYTW